MVNLEPTGEYPIPYDLSPDKPKTFQDELVVAANTVDLMKELGATIDLAPEDLDAFKSLAESSDRAKATQALQSPRTANAASLFLKLYANQVSAEVNEVRSAITAKLMELANCGDPKYELKALELLGKHSDIGLFTERSEITVNYKTADGLESAIKERIKRLLNSDVVDVIPIADSLDEELGVLGPENPLLAEIEDEEEAPPVEDGDESEPANN